MLFQSLRNPPAEQRRPLHIMKTVTLPALLENQCRLPHKDVIVSHKMDISMVWALNNDAESNEMQNTPIAG